MADNISIKRNDLLPAVTVFARDAIGPVDLEGVTATFRMVNVLTGEAKVNAAAQVAINPTFTANASTDTLAATAHGMSEGQDFTLKTTGTLPGALSVSKRYFAINVTLNTLQASLTQGGTPIDITDAGTGTHTLLLGKVSYDWTNGDTDTAGTYLAQIQTTEAGKTLTYPNDSQLLIEIISDLADGTERTVAIKAAMDRTQPQAAPVLTQGEIELEVDRARLAREWQPNTAYKIGDIVVPQQRNGHCYRCVQPGTSRSTPFGYFDWPTVAGFEISDGQSDPILVWEEYGTDRFNAGIFGAETNVYDISRAAQQCWLLKARKASQFVDDGDVSFEQMHKHCVDHANTFRPFRRPTQLVRC